jgi:hypothetical protein
MGRPPVGMRAVPPLTFGTRHRALLRERKPARKPESAGIFRDMAHVTKLEARIRQLEGELRRGHRLPPLTRARFKTMLAAMHPDCADTRRRREAFADLRSLEGLLVMSKEQEEKECRLEALREGLIQRSKETAAKRSAAEQARPAKRAVKRRAK